MTGEKAVARLEHVEHGWEEQLGSLLPSKCLKRLPQGYITICQCAGNYETQRCGCRSARVSCG